MDILKDVLDGIRLERATPYAMDLHAPWAFEVPAYRGFVACYFLLQGQCFAEVETNEHSGMWLDTGDAWVLLSGAPYTLRSEPGLKTVPLCTMEPTTGEKRHVTFTGSGSHTRLVVVALRVDRELTNPLFLSLPGWLHLSAHDRVSLAEMTETVALLQREFASDAAGNTIILDRLGEILLVQVIRAFLANAYHETGCGEKRGCLRGMADPQLGAAMREMHRAPEFPWTVAALGKKAAMSRTAFAVRFTGLVGISPYTYLRRLRMHKACGLLSEKAGLSIAAIAGILGYASEAAFSRAFKRELSMPPAAWRRQKDAVSE